MEKLTVKTDGKRITFTAKNSKDITKENVEKSGKKFIEKTFSDMIKKGIKAR